MTRPINLNSQVYSWYVYVNRVDARIYLLLNTVFHEFLHQQIDHLILERLREVISVFTDGVEFLE
jgi:hypothetical protein